MEVAVFLLAAALILPFVALLCALEDDEPNLSAVHPVDREPVLSTLAARARWARRVRRQ